MYIKKPPKNNASNTLVPDSDLPDDHKQTASRIEFEKSEPIVRLLAQVRKVGMDILFPQSTHDKILACIFVAIRSSSTPAHRELIDMVMAVKESNKISQLEHVSKTKVRGVLALLKHGELLITQGAEGEPVRLYLGQGINTFRDLRERHDVFLGRYMLEHHLFIPAILKSELVWQFEEETKLRRLETLNKLVAQLHYFYKSYISYQQQLVTEAEESGIPIIRATSSDDMNGSGTPSVAATSVPSRNNSITSSIPSRNGSISSPFFQSSDTNNNRNSGSDFGSTTASERSSMRLDADFAGGSRTDEWGNARPQSLPSSLLQSAGGSGASGEQRPKSTAGFTSHQHTQMQSNDFGSGLSSQASSYQPQPARGGGGGGGGYGNGGYSMWGGGQGSQQHQQMGSHSHSHDDSDSRGGARGLEPENNGHNQGGYNVFGGESLRAALPQPPAANHEFNAQYRPLSGSGGLLANGSAPAAPYRGSLGNNNNNNNQFNHSTQQHQNFNRDGFYQQQQHQQHGAPQWAPPSQPFKVGGGVTRVDSSEQQFGSQYMAEGVSSNGKHRQSGDFSSRSFDVLDDSRQQSGGRLGSVRLSAGLNGGGSSSNQLQMDDEANEFLVPLAGVGAEGDGKRDQRSDLDWSDFGAALPGRSSMPQGRSSMRMTSQSLAAALESEKARMNAETN
eukprot:gene22618-28755_t